MKNITRKGFTLVEIMIVVAIIALLAAIAIPNLLRARLSANDSIAKSTLRTLSTSTETFATANGGNYPLDVTSLITAVPAYLNTDYCGMTKSGYTISCTFGIASYVFTADPVLIGSTGTTTYTMTTGGVLTP